ncbi:hypothetical protein TRAPUB_2312 [Trametes pubescens]|uniref:Uncharacterized protein n=1 Tax=Trametes pubescens TaxID=154538 RepID=A0A1M2VH17_TRAPU|nr:hypothetical protein TRAPUB_2312 [Trametes pubescens]
MGSIEGVWRVAGAKRAASGRIVWDVRRAHFWHGECVRRELQACPNTARMLPDGVIVLEEFLREDDAADRAGPGSNGQGNG